MHVGMIRRRHIYSQLAVAQIKYIGQKHASPDGSSLDMSPSSTMAARGVQPHLENLKIKVRVQAPAHQVRVCVLQWASSGDQHTIAVGFTARSSQARVRLHSARRRLYTSKSLAKRYGEASFAPKPTL